MLRAEFQSADQAALVLNAFTDSPDAVGGLNSLTLPAETRDIQSYQVFGVDFETQEAGGGKRSALAASGYLLVGDKDGQAVLEKAKVDKTKLKDVRAYLNTMNMHFVALDQAGDPGAFFQVTKAGPDGAADVTGSFKYSLEMPCGGAIKTFAYHVTADDIAFVASGSKLTSTATDFVEAGFIAGATLIIDFGSTNAGYATISTVSANELVIGPITKVTNMTTVTTGNAVVDEASGSTVTLHCSTY